MAGVTACYPQTYTPQTLKEETNNSVFLYILGKRSDIIPAPNATLRTIKNVLAMRIGCNAPRNVMPQFARLTFTLYSNTLLKHKNKNKLIIYISGKPLLSENLEQGNSMGGIAENFSLEMKYADFLKLTEAEKVTIQLGKIKIVLKPKDIKALNDLNKTTKQLKLPPPSIYM